MATTLPTSLRGDIALPGRSFADRLKQPSYKSPSGALFTFDCETVARDTEKRGTVFEFAQVDGAYVQETGYGARRYPLRCIFWGPDHDRVATAFELALLERGVGKLTHPLYGLIDVVPFGGVGRQNDLVREANQSTVDVVFWTTFGSVYPSGVPDARNELVAALENFDAAAAQQFTGATDLTTTVARANTKNDIRAGLTTVSGALSAVSSVTADVKREFDSSARAVNLGIDVLIGEPLLLARQIVDLIKSPARALAGIVDRLDGYRRLAERIFSTNSVNEASGNLPSLRLRLSNRLQTADLFAMGAVAGSVASVVQTEFRTRDQALTAAADVLAQFDEVVAWREQEYGVLAQVDPGDSYQALHHAVALVAGYLVEISFSLVPERRIVLDRARTLVDLAAELYGSVDDRLDFLINTNNLTGSEILELPAGRTIVYY